MPRTILHVDMDAFFVAVELRRRPELRGKPVVVGGTGARGVVAAASYEARRYGIHSAMPSVRAQRLCPSAVFLPGDHGLYESVSLDVHRIFSSYTPLVEGIALDEAFLDVTGAQRLFGRGEEVAHDIRAGIRRELELTCSVGVATVKLLAKLASEAAKPKATPTGVNPGRGVVVVQPGEELTFLHPHPVQALWGVGPRTLERLHRLGVGTVGDLAALPEDTVVRVLGRANGHHLHQLAMAVDPRPVLPDRAAKSVGHEQTFATDLHDQESCTVELVRMADSVASRLRAHDLAGRTVTLKVRFNDFSTITRSSTLAEPVSSGPVIAEAARLLLGGVDVGAGVRLLGVSVSHLQVNAARQLSFDETAGADWDDASRTVDDIRRRFGSSSIGPASLIRQGELRLARRGQQQWGPDAPKADTFPPDGTK
ncbi:MAG TPA: DNA polymerase IV [Acidimicrobiales bacterium]